jgi:predicted DCC family thiol-disulfide oxidoreductase YuxK
MKTEQSPILFFDGVCNLCNGFIQFIVKWERSPRLRFCSLQSEKGQEMLRSQGLPMENLSTVVLWENGKVYTHSDVPLRVAGYLKLPLRPLRYLGWVPKSIRDGIYNWVARNRYRWFGRKDQCMVPTPELRDRFLT